MIDRCKKMFHFLQFFNPRNEQMMINFSISTLMCWSTKRSRSSALYHELAVKSHFGGGGGL
jgi:hypothetical protein